MVIIDCYNRNEMQKIWNGDFSDNKITFLAQGELMADIDSAPVIRPVKRNGYFCFPGVYEYHEISGEVTRVSKSSDSGNVLFFEGIFNGNLMKGMYMLNGMGYISA